MRLQSCEGLFDGLRFPDHAELQIAPRGQVQDFAAHIVVVAGEVRDHAENAQGAKGLPGRVLAEECNGRADPAERFPRRGVALGQSGAQRIVERDRPAPAGDFRIADRRLVICGGEDAALPGRIEHQPERLLRARPRHLHKPTVGIEPRHTGRAGAIARARHAHARPDIAARREHGSGGVPRHTGALTPRDDREIGLALEILYGHGRQTGRACGRDRRRVIRRTLHPSDHGEIALTRRGDERRRGFLLRRIFRQVPPPSSIPGSRWESPSGSRETRGRENAPASVCVGE